MSLGLEANYLHSHNVYSFLKNINTSRYSALERAIDINFPENDWTKI